MSMEHNPIFLQSLGEALIHSIYQGFIILIIVRVILQCIGESKARLKYSTALLASLALLIWFALTFIHILDEKRIIYLSIAQETASPGHTELVNIHTESADGAGLLFSKVMAFFSLIYHQFSYLLSYLWIIGFLWMIFRLSLDFYGVSNIKRNSRFKDQILMPDKIAQLSQRIKLKYTPVLLESRHIKTPSIIGLIKPVIVFPLGLINGLTEDQVDLILMHELAHLKRFDQYTLLVEQVIKTLFFYHPAVWILCHIMEIERENSCDDLVIENQNCREEYALALSKLGIFASQKPTVALSVAKNKNILLHRIQRILKMKTRKKFQGANAISITIILLLSIVLTAIFSFSFPLSKSANINYEPDHNEVRFVKGISFEDSLAFSAGADIVDDTFGEAEIILKNELDELEYTKIEAEFEILEAIDEIEAAQLDNLRARQQMEIADYEKELAQIEKELAALEKELARIKSRDTKGKENIINSEIEAKIQRSLRSNERILKKIKKVLKQKQGLIIQPYVFYSDSINSMPLSGRGIFIDSALPRIDRLPCIPDLDVDSAFSSLEFLSKLEEMELLKNELKIPELREHVSEIPELEHLELMVPDIKFHDSLLKNPSDIRSFNFEFSPYIGGESSGEFNQMRNESFGIK